MFEGKRYKRMAKAQLKGRKTVAVLATLITLAISFCFEASYERASGNTFENRLERIERSFDFNDSDDYATPVSYIPEDDYDWQFNKSWTYKSGQQWKSSLVYLIQIAIEGILLVAFCHLFNLYYSSLSPVSFGQYLHGFNYWLNGMLGMWWYTLWVALWSLLFIIPGIIKAFAYSQMFFIMAENPKIKVTKAMKISKVMTKGHKGDLFVLGLSFIGWELLSICTLGILQLWLIPYQMMTFTNAYKDMKAQAIKTGVLTLEDFN